MTPEQERSLKRLREALLHHDKFNKTLTDDEPLYMAPGNGSNLFELPYEGGQLAIGDLRNILTGLEK